MSLLNWLKRPFGRGLGADSLVGVFRLSVCTALVILVGSLEVGVVRNSLHPAIVHYHDLIRGWLLDIGDVAGWAGVFGLMLRAVVWVGVIAAMIEVGLVVLCLALILVLALALGIALLLPFGPGVASRALWLELLVEPCPYGSWTVHQLAGDASQVKGLAHSALHSDVQALGIVVSWIKAGQRTTSAGLTVSSDT